MLRKNFYLFAPDSGQGGQEPKAETPAAETTTPGATVADEGKGQQQTGVAGKVDELPEWAQTLVKELRAENGKHRVAKVEAEKAVAASEEKSLADRQEWQKLAEKRQARLDELEPLTTKQSERLARLEELQAKQVEAEIKDWPKEVKELDPGPDDLLARIEWMNKSRPLAQRLMNLTPAPGNGKLPKPAGVGSKPDDTARQMAERKMQQAF